jgi:hypothetical protein
MRIALLVVLATILSVPVSAQPSDLTAGARVRLRFQGSSGALVGQVVDLTADSMVVGVDTGRLRFGRASISRIEVSVGAHSHIARGFLKGALVGGALGGVLGYADGDDNCTTATSSSCPWFSKRQDKAIIDGFLLGVVGALVGGVRGSSVTDEWVTTLQPAALTPVIESNSRSGVGTPAAAEVPRLKPGIRVRLTRFGSDEPVVGTLADQSRDSLLVSVSGDRLVATTRAAISSIEVSTEKRREVGSLITGVAIGAVLGGAVGGVLGYASGSDCTAHDDVRCPYDEAPAAEKARSVASVFAIIGGLIGGWMGLEPVDAWVPHSRATSFAPVIEPSGRLGLSLRF